MQQTVAGDPSQENKSLFLLFLIDFAGLFNLGT